MDGQVLSMRNKKNSMNPEAFHNVLFLVHLQSPCINVNCILAILIKLLASIWFNYFMLSGVMTKIKKVLCHLIFLFRPRKIFTKCDWNHAVLTVASSTIRIKSISSFAKTLIASKCVFTILWTSMAVTFTFIIICKKGNFLSFLSQIFESKPVARPVLQGWQNFLGEKCGM